MIEVETKNNIDHSFYTVAHDLKRGAYDVFYHFKNKCTKDSDKKLGTFTTDRLPVTFTLDAKEERVYFTLLNKETEEMTVLAHRRLPIRDFLNFRDLGGYETTEGKVVKWGALYRSDYLWNLTDEGLPYALNLGIKTVIDLRTDEEISARPNKSIGEKRQVQCNPNAMTAAIAGMLQSRGSEKEKIAALVKKAYEEVKRDPQSGEKQILVQQRLFVTDESAKQAFKKMIETLIQSDHLPAVFHCRGGKDRTGYASYLILSLLGVKEATIMYDYMLTEKYRKKRNETLLQQYREKFSNEAVIDYLYSFFDIKAAFLQASIDEIKKTYPTVESYVIHELGVTAEAIQQLKAKLLV